MNLSQVKTYVSGVLKQWIPNKKVLDKISESDSGNILFNGENIKSEVDISKVNWVGSSQTILLNEKITTTGTYTLNNNVNNYDLILIEYSWNEIQTQGNLLTVKEIIPFICVYGWSSSTDYEEGTLTENILNITALSGIVYINKIIGIKLQDTKTITLLDSRQEKILYDGTISATGTYDLLDNLSNYNELIIEHSPYTTNDNKLYSVIPLINNTWKTVFSGYIVLYGSSSNNYHSFHFSKDGNQIISDELKLECIFKIIGIKYTQSTEDILDMTSTEISDMITEITSESEEE